MHSSENDLEQRLREMGSAERSASKGAYHTRRPNVQFLVSQARQGIAADLVQSPAEAVGTFSRFLMTMNFLVRRLSCSPALSTFAACAIALLGIYLTQFLDNSSPSENVFVFHASSQNIKPATQQAVSSIPNVTNPGSLRPPEIWNLPENIDLDFQKNTVRFREKNVDLRGTIKPLQSASISILSFNFTATGQMGSHATASAKGTLVLTKRPGIQRIHSRLDVETVKVTSVLEVWHAFAITNFVERTYGP